MSSVILASMLFTSGPMEISSGEADYSGHLLSFTNDVSVSISNESTLECPSACFDTDTKKLLLCGSEAKQVVCKTPDFLLTCQKVTTDLTEKWPIKQVTAEGDVYIKNESLEAFADFGYYSINQENEAILTLAAQSKGGRCELKHASGSCVEATTITLNPSKNTLAFNQPVGSLVEGESKTAISAKSLHWDMAKRVVTLLRKIIIQKPNFGIFKASELLECHQGLSNQLEILVGKGSIEAELAEGQKVTAVGQFTLDQAAQKLQVDGAPIVFRDRLGEVVADHATISFEDKQPTKVVLSGNLRIKNFANVDHIPSDTCLHYIIADHATLDLVTQSLRLSSNPERRTLLYDKINNIQVSAPALTVSRNQVTKKETIKGEGDVRFSFSEKELNLIKQRFKLIQHAK